MVEDCTYCETLEAEFSNISKSELYAFQWTVFCDRTDTVGLVTIVILESFDMKHANSERYA